MSEQPQRLTDQQADRVAALLRPYRDLMAQARAEAARKTA